MANSIDLSNARRRSCDPGGLDDSLPDDIPSLDAETTARALREAVWARYEAFGSSVPQDATPVCTSALHGNDFDRCGTVRVRDPVLFHEEGAQGVAIRVGDINQRRLGDCALMAVLVGFASTPEGRALLRSIVVENKTQDDHVASYTVTLHRPYAIGALRLFSLESKVQVPPIYAKGHADAAHDCGQRIVWPLVIERAFAELSGGYDAIADGGTVKEAFEVLTGKSPKHIQLPDAAYRADVLQRDLASGKIVVLSTPTTLSRDGRKIGLEAEHAYTASLSEEDGRPIMLLHNPWNRGAPTRVPLDALQRLFIAVDVASVPGGRSQ